MPRHIVTACRLMLCSLLGLASVFAAGLGDLGSTEAEADSALKEMANELGVDISGKTKVILVQADKPDQVIAPRLFWREIPGQIAADTFPVEVRIGGDQAIAPRQEVLADNLGMITVWESQGAVKLSAGDLVMRPGNIHFSEVNGQLTCKHPAIVIKEGEIRVRCAPVRFSAVDGQGVAAPFNLKLSDGELSLLRVDGPYNPLVIWLPVGLRYESSFGIFELAADGKLQPLQLREGVVAVADGLRMTLPEEAKLVTAAVAPAQKLCLWLFRQRRVFAQGEEVTGFVLVPKGFAGGDAEILAGDLPLGKLALPAVTERQWDARGFTLATGDLPPGEHKLVVRAGKLAAEPLGITIVPSLRRTSSFLVHSMSGCTESPPKTPEGLALLRDAGLEMVSDAGSTGTISTAMPRLAAPPAPGLPAELGWKRTETDDNLEEFLRYRVGYIDLTVCRAGGLYMEGLSYHHSYPPSVDRMIRHMSVFTTQTADYPSWWGPNYTWFPKPGGYAEGGVPTDAHVHDRNVTVAKKLEAAGYAPPSREELKWYQEHKFSADPAERKKAMDILARQIKHWQVYNQFTFGDHNALYNAAVRRIRPDAVCTLFDNAGHDTNNRARCQFNDMAAACYESYTDYGEWPMSAGFTTEWAVGTNPGRPAWITVDWGSTTEGMMKSMFHAFARGLLGGGCPMQASAGPELARRAKGLRLLAQYGTISAHAVPDRQVAILATLSQRMFDGRASYGYHAIYYHLTRLGFPAIIVDEEDALKNGIPKGVRALFLVRQEEPLNDELLAVLKRFQESGGKILATGDSKIELPNVTVVGGEVKDIWRLSGFEWQVHADMWKQFMEVWRAPLTKAMADTGLKPLAATDPERGLALAMDVGPIRYLMVSADAAGTHTTEFHVTEGLPVSVAGTGWQARDLVWQKDVPLTAADGRSTFSVDLLTEPVKILALFKSPPATLAVEQGGTHFRTRVLAADGSDLGAVPLVYTFTAPDGQVRDTLHRAAGDDLDFPIPALDKPGQWRVRVQELLTGVTATHAWTPVPPAATATIKPVGDVHVVDVRQVREFVAAEGEKLILLEAGQEQYLPIAEKLAQKLTAAGVKTRVWQVKPEEYDSIPVRWYPRPEDEVRLKAVADGQLIGRRLNMKPFIDTKKAAHVPLRGGYAEIEPLWMVGKHAILFSGGTLAESLRAVTAWLPTPNIPGAGQGRIVVCFSPFMANRNVAVLAANDAAGFAKAADRLAEFFTAKPAAVPGAASAEVALAKVEATLGHETVPTPFADFAPRRRVEHLLALPDGRAVLHLEGNRDNLAFVSTDGKLTRTCSVPGGTAVFLTQAGDVWSLAYQEGMIKGVCIGADGVAKRSFSLPLKPAGAVPQNRSLLDSFPVAPDGKTLAAGRFGGIQFADLDKGAWRFYDDVPHVWHRYEVWSPRFPIGMTFSPDGRYLFLTMDTRPTGFTNMSGNAFTPTGCETVLLDVTSGERVWAKRAAADPNPAHYYAYVALDSVAYATHSGFAAVARNGAMTALTDYVGQVMLIAKDGKEILLKQAVANVPTRRQYDWGPPGGVGTWISDTGNLAMFGFHDKIVLAAGTTTVDVKAPGMVAGAVATNGTLAVAGFGNGDVIAYGSDGTERWRFAAGGIVPKLAAVAPDQTLVATNTGELIRLDAGGKEVWRVACAKAADVERHQVDAAAAVPLPAPAEYRVPDTLAVAKARLKAQQLAAWTPAGEPQKYAGQTFFRTAPAITLSGKAPEAFVHLVYRRPAESKRLAIVTTGAEGALTFDLDLPTPEFRVVDIPVRGPDVGVEINGDGAVDIAECSLWSITWPGPNVAYVEDAGPGGGTGLATETVTKEVTGLGDELTDIDADGYALAGKLKDTQIFVWNADPDKIQGTFFPARYSPLRVVDGKRFDNGRTGGWPRGRDMIGPWFTETFPYFVPLSLVATYDSAAKQSLVARCVAVFADGDPAERDSGRVLGGAIDNDQFWRLFPITDKKAKRLGVQVRGGANGLCELEAYPRPK